MPLRLELSQLQNMTSNEDLLQAQGVVEVSDFNETEIRVSLRSPIQAGTLVSVQINCKLKERNLGFPATGKVASQTEIEPGLFRVHIQLRQFDGEVWKKILEAFNGDQQRIDHLFNSMKGDR